MKIKEKLTITDWAEEDRPREKMELKGKDALSDAELIAIIIGSGNIKENAVELSQRILNSVDNNLNTLGKFSIKELTSGFKGIGSAKAISIIAALELGRRRQKCDATSGRQFKHSSEVYEYAHSFMADLLHEELWVMFMNQSNRVVKRMQVSRGGVSETSADIRIILKAAVLELTSNIIICHNHPSGNSKPSGADDTFTQKLKEAALLMEVKLLDHLIICDGTYYSYADEGRM